MWKSTEILAPLVRVVCRQGPSMDKSTLVSELEIWRGHLPRVPGVGEHIALSGNWSSELVLDVTTMLDDGSVRVEIATDATGEYASMVAENSVDGGGSDG